MILTGQLTNLRPIRKSDLEHIKGWINDREVQYYSQEDYPFYFNSWHIKYIYDEGIKGKKIIFIIEDKKNSIIGELWLYPIDILNGTTELVITIGKEQFRSKGYGKDAISIVKEYCFRNLKLNAIYLKVFSFNLRAINCYKSCGFKVIDNIKQKVIRNGIYYDELVMELKKNSYDFYN